MADPADLLAEVARVADGVAQVLEPPGYAELLQAVTDAAMNLFSAAACSIALLDDDEAHLSYRVASGAGAGAVVGRRLPLGQGIAGWVVSSGMPIAVDDVAADPRFHRDFAEHTGYLPTSILAMPLQTERGVLGVISVLDRVMPADADATQREMVMLALFARQAALALESGAVFRSAGRVLLTALADATDAGDLLTALEQAPISRGDSAVRELTALLTRLYRADPELIAVVAATVRAMTSYAENRTPAL